MQIEMHKTHPLLLVLRVCKTRFRSIVIGPGRGEKDEILGAGY